MNRLVARLGSLALGIATLWLVVLHALFLWRRLADATLHQPEVLARWLASVLLIGGALAARRYAVRHWHHRHTAAVFWFLVLLIHLSIPAAERLLEPQEILVVAAQTGVAALAVLLALTILTLESGESRSGSAATWSPTSATSAGLSSPSSRAPPTF